MTDLYMDDVTEQVYERADKIHGFGIVAWGEIASAFDTHEQTVREEPEAVAEQLHDEVDRWLEAQQEANATEDEDDGQ